MDRTIEADHLTSLFIPSLTTSVGDGYVRFHQLARTLREQCPWDIEQTHQSLLPYLIEETYEVVDAIQDLDADDPTTDEALIEELGDLLYQIEFHATIAEQEGRFTIADVTRGVHDKLVRRHPHVFGDADGNVVEVDGAGEVLSNWDTIKRAEKSRTSVFDGVPSALPGLAYADTIQSKAAKIGFDWPDVSGALPKIAEEAGELADAAAAGDQATTPSPTSSATCCSRSSTSPVTSTSIPRSRCGQRPTSSASRVEQVEQLAAARGIDMHTADLDTLDAMWNEVKSARCLTPRRSADVTGAHRSLTAAVSEHGTVGCHGTRRVAV